MKLLSINQDSKTIKGLNKGYLTGIMYLAPYTLGGKNICPFAKAAGCINACLNTAGRGIFNNVQKESYKNDRDFRTYLPNLKSKYVIEIKSGEAKKNGILLGDVIIIQ